MSFRIHVAALLFLLQSPTLFAWAQKGHFIANEAAVTSTPAAMPHFFHRAYPAIIEFANEPDQWRSAGASLESLETPDHFLDLEFVEGLKLPAGRYDFLQLLVERRVTERRGIGVAGTGFLPWRVAETAEMLEFQWRIWRRPGLQEHERAQVEAAIVRLSTMLAHFVADAANPHHTTMHYNGWLAENPNGYARDCETHSRFETYFVGRAIALEDVIPRIAEPEVRTDYFAAALGLVRESNSLVETLYRIDRDGGLRGAGSAEARHFAAARLAAGASMMRDLWWSAYVNSAGNRGPSAR